MPSNKDPALIVLPGPGRVPAGSVPSGALIGGGGGGGGAFAALQAHINNPLNAHYASAVGVNPYYPPNVGPTSTPILSSVGGVVAGESVLDFINQFKDLIPPTPNYLGYSAAAGGSGVPNWGLLNALGVGSGTSVTGGYASAAGTGQPVTFSHFLVPSTSTTFGMSGIIYPADRGVLAFYSTTSGNFFDAAHTTLVAALSLNDTAPAGIPNAAFSESLRNVQQPNYVPADSGFDYFGLTYRLPYLTSYSAYPGTPFGPFTYNFFSFQLAVFSLASQAVAAGNAQSFLLVQWKETYATSLAAIQPASLTSGNLTSTNCYSAVPVGSNFDDNTQPIYNLNRHNVFRDTVESTPAGTVFTSAPVGTTTTIHLSGVSYYNSTGLEFNVNVEATGLFSNSFETGSSTSPPNVPLQFASSLDPIRMAFGNFGGGTLDIPYYSMNKLGGSAYSNANTPQPGDTGQYLNATMAIVGATSFCPVGGAAQLVANLYTPFKSASTTDANKYLYDTYNQTGSGLSTTQSEPFVDEYYRYSISPDPSTGTTPPIVPSNSYLSGSVFPSATALASGGSDLQVVGHEIVYPATNYDVSTYLPAQTAAQNYSTIAGADGAQHLRRYLRLFDTGTNRNTGIITITNVAASNFAVSSNTFDGNETTGHLSASPNGGMMIHIKIPGVTGWLDLGRAFNSPGVGIADFYGCATLTSTSGSTVQVTYNSTAFTGNNGSGQFPLFVRITYINGIGNGYAINSISWAP